MVDDSTPTGGFGTVVSRVLYRPRSTVRRRFLERLLSAAVTALATAWLGNALEANAQSTLLQFSTTGLAGNEASLSASTTGSGIAAGSTVTRSSGLSATSGTNSFMANSFVANNATSTLSTGRYFTFTVAPAANHVLGFTNLTGGVRASTSGPTNMQYVTVIDSSTTALGSAVTMNNSDQSFSATLTNTGITSAVEFRLVGWRTTGNANSSTGTGRFGNATSPTTTLTGSAVLRSAATLTWDGGRGSGNWDAYDGYAANQSNWNINNVPSSSLVDSLTFAGSTQTTSTNNISGLTVGSIVFASGAGAFTNSGNALTLNGDITNSSSNPQTVGHAIALSNGNHAIDANGGNITLSGSVTGAGGSITKNGGSTLSLTNASNSFATLTIHTGTVSIGANTTITGLSGTGGALNLSAGTLTLNQAASGTALQPFSGSGNFTKTGNNALTLTGSSGGYTGTITVSNGTLVANGNLGGTMSVSNGASLMGSGSVGVVSITTGATLSPGNSPGVLTTGNMTWDGGGNYNWQLLDAAGTAGTGWDLVSGTGSLTINATTGNTFNLNLWTLASTSPDVSGAATGFDASSNFSWKIATFTGGITGATGNWYTINTGSTNGTGGFANSFTGGTFSLATAGNDLNLVYTAPLVGTSWDYAATGGSWSTAANWNPATLPSGTAQLSFSGGGGTATNDISIPQVSSLTFTGSATAGYTITGNALTLGSGGIANNSAFHQAISTNVTLAAPVTLTSATAGVALTLSGTLDTAGNALTVTGSGNTSLATVSGAGTFSKTGSGTATLTAAIEAPTVTVNSGAVIANASNILADSGTVTISGGSLDLGANTDTVSTFSISGGTLSGVGTLTAGTYALTGGTMNANLGGGSLAANSGAATLNGTSGATQVIVGGGSLTTGGANVLSDAAAVTLSSGGLTLGGNDTVGSFSISGGTLAGAGTLTAGTYALTGGIVNANLGAGTLTANSGAAALNGTSGATMVSVGGGSLTTGGVNVLADSAAVTLSSGGLTLGGNDTVGSFTITGGTLGGSATLTAATYALGGGTVAANLGGGAATSSSGSTALNGTLAGDLTLAGGTVTLGAAERIGASSSVTINSGSLGIGGFADSVGTFTISGGSLGGSGTLTAATYSLQGGTVAANLGDGTLTASTGVTALTGSSAATTVNINSGTLTLGASNRLADTATVTVAGGVLDTAPNATDTVGTLAISAGAVNGGGTITAGTYSLTGGTVNANLGGGTLNANSGAATLAGTAGATIVNIGGGTLATSGADKLANSAAVTLSSGGLTLGGNDTVGAYSQSGGTLGGSSTLTAASYALTGGTVNANLGGGTLTAASGSTAIIGTVGATTVTISGGTLGLASAGRLSNAAAVTMSAGALTLGGNETVTSYTQTGGALGGSGTLTATTYSVSGGTLSAQLAGSGTVTMTGGSLVTSGGSTVSNPIAIGGLVSTPFYTQNFNALGTGLPANWTTGTGASTSSLGTTVAFTGTAPAEWAATASGFKNFASTAGLTAASGSATQTASADRALGIRQTSGFGDPGAAFNYAFSTTGQTIDSISLDLLMLSVQSRSTTWSIEYGLGAAPTTFNTLGTWPDPGTWGTTSVSYSGTAVSGMSNQGNVVFRVAAISGAATGSGNRDSMGIDNFQINTLAPVAASAQVGINSAGVTTYSGPIAITGTADLTAVAGGTATFSGIISGSAGIVTKTGDGVVILAGNNTYGGLTTISAGGLLVSGSNAGTGLVSVASDAWIGGKGSLAGGLTLASGAKLVFDPSTTDGLDVTGAVTLDNSFSVLSLVSSNGGAINWSSIADGTYTLIGLTSSTFNSIGNFGLSNAYVISPTRKAYFDNGSLNLVIVPEPSAIALAGLGAGLAGYAAWRRRRAA